MSQILKARSALGVAARRKNSGEVTEARRNLAAAKLEEYVARIVSEAPPLTNEQADRIAGLLRGDAA